MDKPKGRWHLTRLAVTPSRAGDFAIGGAIGAVWWILVWIVITSLQSFFHAQPTELYWTCAILWAGFLLLLWRRWYVVAGMALVTLGIPAALFFHALWTWRGIRLF